MVQIIEDLPRYAMQDEIVAIDIEMFGQEKERLHRPHGTFACISVMYANDPVVYQVYDPTLIPEVFDRLMLGDWTLVNATYDFRQLRRWDTHGVLSNERPVWDCMLVEQNLFGGYYRDFSMKDMMRRYFDIQMNKETREDFSTATAMTDEMKQYAAMDVVYTLDIRFAQTALDRDLSNYWLCDAPMIWVLLDILPVKVEVEKWKTMVDTFAVIATTMEKQLGFNVKSVQQVMKALQADGIKVESTGAKVLEPYAKRNDMVAKILKTRKYRDACSKYGVGWLENSVEEGNLVYANFLINGASTGRMACRRPNLQNIPRKEFPEYRELFVSNNGLIMAPDVSQQEPRILGYLSKDTNLLAALSSGESVHVYVARMIYNDPTIVKDGKDIRYAVGKAINLAIGYGLTSKGLSDNTGLTEAESQKVIDIYFNRFPGVKYYMQKFRNMAYKDGYITTVAGRRIYVNPYDFKSENNAINSPIQGGAADFTKLWAITYWRECKKQDVPFFLCMLVHDELVLDVVISWKAETTRIINESMQVAAQMYPGIPFTSDLNEGKDWSCHT